MRKTGGACRRQVEMRIIDCLCKQFFLIATADGAYKKRNSYPNQVTRAVSFFYKFTRKYTHASAVI